MEFVQGFARFVGHAAMSPFIVRHAIARNDWLRERVRSAGEAVIGGVSGRRIRAAGVRLARQRFSTACYAQAWQGLYAAVLEQERQIESPSLVGARD